MATTLPRGSPDGGSVIAADAGFDDEVPSWYFPTAPTNWCMTETLGIRATLNAVPIHKPVYFCRFVP